MAHRLGEAIPSVMNSTWKAITTSDRTASEGDEAVKDFEVVQAVRNEHRLWILDWRQRERIRQRCEEKALLLESAWPLQ